MAIDREKLRDECGGHSPNPWRREAEEVRQRLKVVDAFMESAIARTDDHDPVTVIPTDWSAGALDGGPFATSDLNASLSPSHQRTMPQNA